MGMPFAMQLRRPSRPAVRRHRPGGCGEARGDVYMCGACSGGRASGIDGAEEPIGGWYNHRYVRSSCHPPPVPVDAEHADRADRCDPARRFSQVRSGRCATTPTGPYAINTSSRLGSRCTTTSPRMARSRRHISPAKMDSLCIAGVFYSCPTLRVVPYTTDMISPNRGTGRTIGS